MSRLVQLLKLNIRSIVTTPLPLCVSGNKDMFQQYPSTIYGAMFFIFLKRRVKWARVLLLLLTLIIIKLDIILKLSLFVLFKHVVSDDKKLNIRKKQILI